MIATDGDSSGRTYDWDENPDRWATQRARYVERASDFDATAATIIAWAELGYSHSGIAKQVDVSESTVRARMDEIRDDDRRPLDARTPDELQVQSPAGIDGTKFGGDA